MENHGAVMPFEFEEFIPRYPLAEAFKFEFFHPSHGGINPKRFRTRQMQKRIGSHGLPHPVATGRIFGKGLAQSTQSLGNGFFG